MDVVIPLQGGAPGEQLPSSSAWIPSLSALASVSGRTGQERVTGWQEMGPELLPQFIKKREEERSLLPDGVVYSPSELGEQSLRENRPVEGVLGRVSLQPFRCQPGMLDLPLSLAGTHLCSGDAN